MTYRTIWTTADSRPGACRAVLLAAGLAVFASAPASANDRLWFATTPATNGASGATSSGGAWNLFGLNNTPRPSGKPRLSKSGIEPLKKAVARYRGIVKQGGWKRLPRGTAKLKLQPGARHAAVAALRRRLRASGDLRSGAFDNTYFDYTLQKALMHFQARHGLKPTGDLVNKSRRRRAGSRTINALNVSAKSRLRQLKANLQRLRTYSRRVARKKRYIMVNIPEARAEAVESGRVALRHTAVVGKAARATPLLSSRVHEINFNPAWTLPPTVIREDLIPKGRRMQRRKQDVLTKYEIDAYRTHGGRKIKPSKINWNSGAVRNYVYRQEPGPNNPLGFVKINFHNVHSVYMHDTPKKTIFGRADRAASSGCIRIQNIDRLVSWILKDTKGWSPGRVRGMQKSGTTKSVRVRRPVALYFVYITAWADANGQVSFRHDLYGRDRRRFGVRTAAVD